MDRNELERLLDDAVAGLADDPELRLDVRRELLVHVEDAVAAQPEGPDAERLGTALKALGPVTEMTGALAEANRRRMRWRGWARLMLARAAVPVAILVAVGVAFEGAIRGAVMAHVVGGNFNMTGMERELVRGLSEDDAFFLLGDVTREDRADRQRAIWERHPDKIMYFGNYVSQLPVRARAGHEDGRVEEALRQGMVLEPDNARYPFLLAYGLLERSVDWEEPPGAAASAESAGPAVRDWAGVDEALRLLQTAGGCARYQRYAREVMTHRLEILPDAGTLRDQLVQRGFAAGTLLPDLQAILILGRGLDDVAGLLATAGREEDAVALASLWERLPGLFRHDAFLLIDALVLAGWINAGESIAASLETMGRMGEAEHIRHRVDRWGRPFRQLREQRTQGPADLDAQVNRHGSVLTSVLVPALGHTYGEIVDPRELAPSRWVEFVLAEQLWSAAMLLLLLVLMLGALAVWIRWRHASGAASAPILLVPRAREAAAIFAAGVAIPVLAYLAYSRLPGIGGRAFALQYLPYRFAAEFLLLGVTVGTLAGAFASRFVRRRCLAVGVDAPPRGRIVPRILAGLLILGWALCPLTRIPAGNTPLGAASFAVACLAAALALGMALAGFARKLRAHPRYGLYHGTWGRTLTPTYATAILLLALLTQPYLRRQEHAWIQRDTLMALDDQAGGFTGLEARVTQRLMDDFNQAWTQTADEP